VTEPRRPRFRFVPSTVAPLILGAALLAGVVGTGFASASDRLPNSTASSTDLAAIGAPRRVYLPYVSRPVEKPPCQPVGGQSYGTTPPDRSYRPTTDAERDPELNLAIRGYFPVAAAKALVTYNNDGSPDPYAPRLYGLYSSPRSPVFNATYLVHEWDSSTNQRLAPDGRWPVHLAGLNVSPGEMLRVPDGPGVGQDIGDDARFEVMVLYASPSRITLKYTREDNVIWGYTVHVENACIDPDLVALYRQMDGQGRGRLPALVAGQVFGRAQDSEVDVAIRDTGTFMDPRSFLDWWD
jgi:hypothetical protein